MIQSGQPPQVSGRQSPGVSMPRLRLDHLWMLLPVFVVTSMGFAHPLRRLDFWWHLKAGEIIVSTRHIPRVDLFSFTQAGQPFIHQNWLGEVLYYLTSRLGGPELLILANTVLLLLALLPIFALCLQTHVGRRTAALCSLVAAVVLGMYSNVRPQVYSFALFALFYWILWSYRDGRRNLLWALPLLMVLWVNLHGAFVLGVGLIAIFLLAETVRLIWYGPRTDLLTSRALAQLALILLLTVLAVLLNPEGYRVFSYVRQLQVDPSSQQLVTEWQPPDIKELNSALMFFVPLLVSLLALLYGRDRLNLTELSLFLVFALFGLSALRNGVWFALVVAPLLARHVNGQTVPRSERGLLGMLERRRQGQRQVASAERPWLNWVVLLCLLLFLVLLSPWVRPHLKSERLRPQLLEEGTPIGAMDYIAEHALTGHIFHPQAYGDYLIWRLWPQQRSFIDGRVHLYPLQFVQDYILALNGDRWESRLARYDIQYLLLPKGDPSCTVLIQDARSSPGWKLLYEDDLSILFEGAGVTER